MGNDFVTETSFELFDKAESDVLMIDSHAFTQQLCSKITPPPLLEAGVSFKPLVLAGLLSGRAARKEAQTQAASGTVYFEPDSAVPTEDSLSALDKAGRFLAANRDTVIVRQYYAG